MRTRTCAVAAEAIILAVVASLLGSVASADETKYAFRPADTSSPQATLKEFIDSCNELNNRIRSVQYFDGDSPEHHPVAVRILDCLDASDLPEYSRLEASSEAAVCLKEILDRVELPPYKDIPDTKKIEDAGGVEKFSRWQIPGTRITITRVEEGPRRHEYLFSPGTVGRAVEYYRDVQAIPYRTKGPDVSEGFHDWYISAPSHPAVAQIVAWLPDWTRKTAFGLAIWSWIGLLFSLVVGVALMVVAYRLQRKYAAALRDGKIVRYCLTIVFPVMAMLIPMGFAYTADRYLTLRGMPLYVASFSANMTTILAAIVVVFAVCNRVAELIISSPRISPQGLDAQLIRIISRLLGMSFAVVIFLAGGQYLGIPLTTMLAGAGVGGLAVALAAQDSLKTIFGTIMLMADKPFRVGERIVFEKYDGVVEDIGLRSTRIRLLTGHLATIPNDELARNDIENVGRRPYIRRITNIHIPLDTQTEKLQKAIEIVEAALVQHDGMDPEFPPRVYFNEFNPGSFNIRVIYWYSPPDYWEFLKFSQTLNLEICRAFEEQGISFSLPERVAHTSIDGQENPLQVRMVEG